MIVHWEGHDPQAWDALHAAAAGASEALIVDREGRVLEGATVLAELASTAGFVNARGAESCAARGGLDVFARQRKRQRGRGPRPTYSHGQALRQIISRCDKSHT
jgi:hypothetical protein